MRCPYCETDLRVDADIDNDGKVLVVVECQNDRDRTEYCLRDVKTALSLTTETGIWVLRPEGVNG